MDIIDNMYLFRSDYQTQSQTQSQKFEWNMFNPSIEKVVLKPLDKSHAGEKGARNWAILAKFCQLSFPF